MKTIILIMVLAIFTCNDPKETWMVKDIETGAVKKVNLEEGYQIGDTIFTAVGQNYNVIIRKLNNQYGL